MEHSRPAINIFRMNKGGKREAILCLVGEQGKLGGEAGKRQSQNSEFPCTTPAAHRCLGVLIP